MKKIYYFLILAGGLLTLNLNSIAQKDSSGIYLTAEDFTNRKLAYAINCGSESHRIKLNDFFGKSFITVKHFDSSYKLYKTKIFGYRTCEGKIVRFDKKKELILLNPNETILIYRHDVARPPRGLTNVTNLYFSKDAFSPVQKLTIKSLKEAFPENRKFHEQLDVRFKYNTELALFDNIHNMYSINWIYQNK